MPIVNTGYKAYTKLIKVTNDANNYPLDVNNNLVSVTGITQDIKDNVLGQADYIAPIQDLISCPLPIVAPVVPPVVSPSIVFSNGSGFSASPFGGVDAVTSVSGNITVIGGTYRLYSSASIYTNNSTTVSCDLIVGVLNGSMYSEIRNASGTNLSSNFIDLPAGVYPYTFHVRGSGLGGSGSGGVSINLL